MIHYVASQAKFTQAYFYKVFVDWNLLDTCLCLMCPGLRVEWTEEYQRRGYVVSVPPEVYKEGCVHDVDDGLAVSVLIKKNLFCLILQMSLMKCLYTALHIDRHEKKSIFCCTSMLKKQSNYLKMITLLVLSTTCIHRERSLTISSCITSLHHL